MPKRKGPGGGRGKVMRIEEVYASKGKPISKRRVDWEVVADALLRGDPHIKNLIKSDERYKGLLHYDLQERRSAIRRLGDDSGYRLWKQNRLKLSKDYLTKGQAEELESLHDRCNKIGHSFWWDVRVDSKGRPQVIMSYDTNPPNNTSPRRTVIIRRDANGVRVSSRWKNPDEGVKRFNEKITVVELDKKRPHRSAVWLPDAGTAFDHEEPDKAFHKTINEALNHYWRVMEKFK